MELGKYTLFEELGRGGYGIVYRALDNTLKVERAVKILHTALTADVGFIDRFQREAQVAARLEHSHIVPVYDIGEDDGYYYLAMKHMAGGSLNERLKGDGRLPYQTALEMVNQIGGALEKAHNEGLVHRDVKPGNIMLEEGESARLADFGFAKAMQVASSVTLTTTGGMVGTPAYMAPELWNDMEASPATDLYSLACVFYEMLLGEMLFGGKTSTGIMKKHVMEPPRFPGEWPQGVPAGIEDVLEKALAKEVGDRYKNIGEFLDELQRIDSSNNLPFHSDVRSTLNEECHRKKSEEDGSNNNVRFTNYFNSVLKKLEEIGSPQVENMSNLPMGSTMVWDVDGMQMVYVPAGEFLMGSSDDDQDALDGNEKPQHLVYLGAYWIDKHEVTNAMFATFVKETGYITDAEKEKWSITYDGEAWREMEGADWQHPQGRDSNINGLARHPVVNVSWKDAIAYCEWAGKRLPTEAEWEKAARGTDGRVYPWGDNKPNNEMANYRFLSAGSTPVGSYPAGASPYGVLDMAGNVWEWVNDWYDENYYKKSPARNPLGPSSGVQRVNRGGSWYDLEWCLRSANRSYAQPDLRGGSVGFRCALSAVFNKTINLF